MLASIVLYILSLNVFLLLVYTLKHLSPYFSLHIYLSLIFFASYLFILKDKKGTRILEIKDHFIPYFALHIYLSLIFFASYLFILEDKKGTVGTVGTWILEIMDQNLIY